MSGASDLQLPSGMREGLLQHIKDLREGFHKRGWVRRSGFGERPAVIVIDLARAWTDAEFSLGSDLDSAVEHTRVVLDAAREAGVPIFFTVVGYGPDDPPTPWHLKTPGIRDTLPLGTEATELDPRLGRRPEEKLIVKKYESCFKGTDLRDMLAALGVDTLVVTGCSTMHCVQATCRDAVSGFRVVVPEEAVADRCELYHLVALLDIDATLADVLPTEEVVAYLQRVGAASSPP